MNRRGFAYLIAVLILGLLAFMGLFLQQSSTAEYSQAAISVYRTMGRQLAEAAAEEAFVMLEERFRDKTDTGFQQQLLWQASTAQSPKNGGSTGLNPTLLHDFSDLKDKVRQVLALKDYHMTRAGFEIEKILPTIKDLRPIPNGPLDNNDNFYRSPDRLEPFDNHYSRDFYLTLQLDVTVALQKRRTFRIKYTISRDVKFLNLGPLARNYTMFSTLGHRVLSGGNSAQIESVLRNEMNMPDRPGGRLFLWNMPFQSRVYMHGPSIINLETPQLAVNRSQDYGAYNIYEAEYPRPGPTQAYQYSDTFYGMSYFDTIGRAIFPPKNLWDAISAWWRPGKPTKSDEIANQQQYLNLFEKATVYGGLLPKRGRTFTEVLGDVSSRGLQDTYFRGTNINQKFLPAGPFCRTPWRYVSATLMYEDRYQPNSLADYDGAKNKRFPSDDKHLKIEHRWNRDDAEVAEKTRIYAKVHEIKYNNVTNEITKPPKEKTMDFSLSYHNNPDPEGFFGTLGYSLSAIGESFWNSLTMPFKAVGVLVSPLISRLWPGSDTAISAEAEQQVRNLFPTNFKYNFEGMATMKLADESQIPTDDVTGRWKLNGVYWLDSFQLDSSITYTGTGTIMVTRYNPDRPFTIRGNIIALKAADGVTPLGHLNIFYHPYSAATAGSADISDKLMIIEGSKITIEASVFSCFGLKTMGGDITDWTSVGIYHDRPTNEWEDSMTKIVQNSNVIIGNYVNFYMSKYHQQGDVWVIHNFNNPFYFSKLGSGYRVVQEQLDADNADEKARKAYELMTHEFFLSPKIQHMALTGGNS